MHKSNHLSKRVTQQIFNAFDFAKAKGTELTHFLVINLKDTIQQSAYTAVKKLFHKFGDWLAYKRKKGHTTARPTYAYTLENPSDNIHLNWCVHIPTDLTEEFMEKIPKWMAKIQGSVDADTVWCSSINQSRYKSPANYMVKGTDPEFIEYFFLRPLYDEKGPQGPVFGRRGGVSHSLGPKGHIGCEFQSYGSQAKKTF